MSRRPDLNASQMLEKVQERTGLDDFGDDWFHRPMAVMLDAIKHEARLNPLGLYVAREQFEKVLCDRLWAQRWFARHPEILARPMPRPVVVAGPMRSGTTRLHRLLAADHRFSHLRFFETICPVPYPGFDEGLPDPRPAFAKRALRAIGMANPRTASIHPTGPMQPEEELGLLVNSMWGMKHEAQWQIPSYGRWAEREDPLPAYEQLGRLLRLVSWSQQDSSLKPWILKTPQHMLDLPALLKVFPDARVIFIHRDPLAVVGSACSLVWNQTILYSDHTDPFRVGRQWLDKTHLQIERMRSARRDIASGRMIDVHYEEMDSDWMGVMSRIYDFLGLEIEPALPAMATYMDNTGAGVRRRHQYSLPEFGLKTGQVLERMASYVREFDVPLATGRSQPVRVAMSPARGQQSGRPARSNI